MKHWTVNGGRPLFGTVAVQGAKNSALPIMAATLLCHGKVILENCPRLSDIDAAAELLRCLDCTVQRRGSALMICTDRAKNAPLCSEQTGKLRASVNFMGAMLARFGETTIGRPGGCVLGKRPIDYHLAAFSALGATVENQEDGYILRWNTRTGGVLRLPFPSVGATENILLAALSAPVTVTILGAACEPEVEDLCRFLAECGADIDGIGTDTLTVCGGKPLHGVRHRLIPDRMETATYLAAAAACGGRVRLTHTDPRLLLPVLSVMELAGCELHLSRTSIECVRQRELRPFGCITTGGYPSFPTDAQAPLMAASLAAVGYTSFTELVFPERFAHVGQLRRFGGEIAVSDATAIVHGGMPLHGALAKATDLRGGAGVLIAALAAEGKSSLYQMHLLDRGYAQWPKRFRELGAELKTEEDKE